MQEHTMFISHVPRLYVNSFRLCVYGYLSGIHKIGTHTHTHRWNELTYSHIPTLFVKNVKQHSNSVTWQSGATDPLKMVSKETETCRGEFQVF
jgi:hypothetical protein